MAGRNSFIYYFPETVSIKLKSSGTESLKTLRYILLGIINNEASKEPVRDLARLKTVSGLEILSKAVGKESQESHS